MTTDKITPLPAGTPAPDFSLPDILIGQTVTLSAFRGQIVVVNFWSPKCPWSAHYDPYWVERAPVWEAEGIVLLQIGSNADETVEELIHGAGESGMRGPILRDEGNAVADAYGAITTPHVFVIDRDGLLAYQGALDDRTFRQREAAVNHLDSALEALRDGRPPHPANTPAYGCTIVRAFDA
jgi:peroxiredoxin